MYELPHKLLNDLSTHSPSKNEKFVNTSKKVPKNSKETLAAARYTTRKPQPAPNTPRPTAAPSQHPPKLAHPT